MERAVHGNGGGSATGADEDHLHAGVVNALLVDGLPVAHAVGVVALELASDLSILVPGVHHGVDGAAQLSGLIHLFQVLVHHGLVGHGNVGAQHLQSTDAVDRGLQRVVVHLKGQLDDVVAILVVGQVVGGGGLGVADGIGHQAHQFSMSSDIRHSVITSHSIQCCYRISSRESR